VAGIAVVGAFEGFAVGVAQWLALRTTLPGLAARSWVAATVAGATVAWGVGMAIGTRMGDSAGTAEPTLPMLLGGAAVIGGLAGAILAVPQWLVLRRLVARAGWWVPAHVLGWALGMLVAFVGVAAIGEQTPPLVAAGIGATTGLVMGALVAAMTGLAVAWLV
jgi:hypothetical protein